ncbi:MAG: sulfur carrier protein ThiS [Candidatus Caldarchaeum sp.]|nr:sulfur carrier protein ThiS [Candidatus Caldarchaeum sp.]MCX8201481.1 sulfur carrier protein ThiS [Candidatus Caldarchaeum sp.]MDW8063917.1 sulfur carrier protein ThiS [Candidatus Caldarchaeum sp.]MDW8434592.1 sulfur carrier protein ThiS [Candidatus Caldarchaeum sp.]
MKYIINGVEKPYIQQNIHQLLQSHGIDPEKQGIAVAVNGEVIARSMWRNYVIKPGDRVDIVTAVAGG